MLLCHSEQPTMKAIIASFIILLLFPAETNSQTIPNSGSQLIPNAGFENWYQDIWGNYCPVDWETNNGDYQPTTITVSSGYQGSYSLRAYNYWGSYFGGDMFSYAKCTVLLSGNPGTLNAYVKTEFDTTDTVSIQVQIFYNGLVVDSGKWICTDLAPISFWTPVSVSITQSSISVDSAVIEIDGGIYSNTSLYVDELAFINTGLHENENNPCCTVFPNPFGNEIIIQNNSSQPIQFTLYNSIGENIIDKILSAKTNTINLTAFSNGVYFYRLSHENEIIKSGNIIKQ